MLSNRWMIVYSCFVLCTISSLIKGDAGSEERTYVLKVKEFSVLERQARDEVVDGLTKAYDACIDDLINQVKASKQNDMSRAYPIYLLGRMRGSKAVSLLIDNIDWSYDGNETSIHPGKWGKFPALEALSAIGLPSVFQGVERLAIEEKPQRREMLCSLLAGIESVSFAKQRVAVKVAAETDTKRKENYEAAASILARL